MKTKLSQLLFISLILAFWGAFLPFTFKTSLQNPGVALTSAQAKIVKCSGTDCKLNDLTITIIEIARWILGIVGSLALLMFIYGGVMLLISGGNQQRVDQGRQILTNAVIGLVVVFASYLIIGLVLSALGVKAEGWTVIGGWLN